MKVKMERTSGRTRGRMKETKQKLRLPIRKFEFEGGCLKKRRHSKLLPNFVRALIVGPSNCGKTNLMLSLLVDPNGLKFENVYLFSKTTDQPKYQHLEKILGGVKGIGFYVYKGVQLKAEEIKKNSVCIFDDVMTENQKLIRDCFSMGRHLGPLDVFELGQTYSKFEKQLIRDNANLIILFKMDEMNLRHAYNDHVAADMTFQEFQEMCNFCWKEPHGFILIDKESPKENGGYRKGLDNYISLSGD